MQVRRRSVSHPARGRTLVMAFVVLAVTACGGARVDRQDPTPAPTRAGGATAATVSASGSALDPGTGKHTTSITADGVTRWFHYYVPASFKRGSGALLFALHGVNGGMDNMWEERQDLVKLADRDGFVVVFPNGQNENGNKGSSSWAGAWCCAYAFRSGHSDVEFVRAMIDAFVASPGVDPRRVYSMGFSNGGILTYQLAAKLADRFAAVAAFASAAGGIGGDRTGGKLYTTPGAPVPFLIMHGTDDQVAPYDGGESPKFAGTIYISQQENVGIYATAYRCAAKPETTTQQGRKGALTTARFTGCAADLVAVRMENVGHGWPDPEFAGFDGSAQAWEFLEAHVRP